MKKTGFTLTELILVVVILGILMTLTVPLISATLDAWLISSAERDLTFNARLALNRVAREIRQAANITAFNVTSFNFSDVDNKNIRFYQSGTNLNIVVNNTTNSLTSFLKSAGGLYFTYYDANGTITTNSTLIRRVGIKLNLYENLGTIKKYGGNNTTADIAVESLVRFRNIK